MMTEAQKYLNHVVGKYRSFLEGDGMVMYSYAAVDDDVIIEPVVPVTLDLKAGDVVRCGEHTFTVPCAGRWLVSGYHDTEKAKALIHTVFALVDEEDAP